MTIFTHKALISNNLDMITAVSDFKLFRGDFHPPRKFRAIFNMALLSVQILSVVSQPLKF